MLKIDLHTHSIASPDGGLKLATYERLLTTGQLDYIAVTDHNTTALALDLYRVHGDRIIVGAEIKSSQGELIGLFLKKDVKPGQSALQTAKDIKAQDGLVYIPHPLETVRKGVSLSVMDELRYLIDIVEVSNGRALFQNRGPAAATWARLNRKAAAASSDAHTASGIGRTYTLVAQPPTADNLVAQLAKARLITDRPPLTSLLSPKANRIIKRFKK